MSFQVIQEAVCLLLLLALISEVQGTAFNVKSYGAKADGQSDDSQVVTFINA